MRWRYRSARFWGIALMVTGLFIVILAIPVWLWVGMLGLILIVAGFLLWRTS